VENARTARLASLRTPSVRIVAATASAASRERKSSLCRSAFHDEGDLPNSKVDEPIKNSADWS
jgi:hypothetical protein